MFKGFSDEALQAELDRRKAERDEKAKPQPRVDPDWSAVREMAISYVESALRGEREDEDTKHYIYDVVLTAVYGADIFNTLNTIWK